MLASYSVFKAKYTRIIAAAASLLRPKHLGVIVVGNMRGEGGILHPLHADTISAFQAAGCGELAWPNCGLAPCTKGTWVPRT